MRKIEFRAWDKEKKYMAYDFSQSTAKEYRLSPGKSIHGLVYDIGLLNGTLMQFTGLLDKNGVKIFEGDRLECLGYQGVVGFDTDEARFSITPEFCNDSYALIRDEMHAFEVIGNIHEAKS